MSPGLAMDPQRRCAPLRGPRLDRLPPKSNSWSASCRMSERHDCANSVAAARGPWRGCRFSRAADRPAPPRRPATCRHGIVSGIIIPPHFRPAPAPLDCEKKVLRWPGPFGSGFLSPQPPGVVRIGPISQIVYPHTGPAKVGPFCFLGVPLLGSARGPVRKDSCHSGMRPRPAIADLRRRRTGELSEAG